MALFHYRNPPISDVIGEKVLGVQTTPRARRKNARETPVLLMFTHQVLWFSPLLIKLIFFLFFIKLIKKKQIFPEFFTEKKKKIFIRYIF